MTVATQQGFDWKVLVRGIAPTIGAAFGGPLAGAAIKVLAEALLGNPNADPADVEDAIRNGQLTPEQIVQIRRADIEFRTEMRRLDIDLVKVNQASEEAYLKDIQSAREQNVAGGQADNVFWLGIVGLVVFSLVMAGTLVGGFALLSGHLTPASTEAASIGNLLIGTVIGYVAAMGQTVWSYFFGSNKNSAESGKAVQGALNRAIERQPIPAPDVRADRVVINNQETGASSIQSLPPVGRAMPDDALDPTGGRG